ncbi:MAG: hypothetical protein HYS17_00980 [Micavibrio aeruginosavorus]|uniref:CR-type domain-containing protein n=1 Tax=Micavibrio aeruginosavorus TaxID=349221 RepID=A0A7T5R2K7_9BACT|nr:MAG: hypothetical protein HYS17_00980 [Micavibrio aeruginosavorus]
MSDDPFANNEPLTIENPETFDGPEPVPDELLEKAVKKVQAVVRGNGMRGLQVALADFEGEILKFEAYEVYKMDPQTAEKRVNGKQNGEVVGSAGDMKTKMNALLEKITENPDVKKNVIELMKKRPDLGFALENQTISLDRFNKTYVVHELCTSCSGARMLACGVCHGDGRAVCYRCKGAMLIECPLCQGHRTISAGGGRKTCTKCNGKGRAPCPICRGRGVTPCKNCKGTGKLPCQPCGTTGWHSLIGSLVVKAKCRFWYDKEALVAAEGAPEIPPLIDQLGAEMVTDRHADISLIEDEARLKELDREVKGDEFKIPYKVRLPWGNISFRLKDRIIKGKLFGLHPELVHMDPFLEEPLFPGLRLLDEAARAPGDAAAKIKEAAPYRAVGEAVVLAARLNPSRAYEAFAKRYPFGLKIETMQKMLISAETALKNVTKKPRRIGLAMGMALNALVFTAFYALPIRPRIYNYIPDLLVQALMEVFLLLLCMGLSWLIIQSTAASALHQALAHLLPPEKRKGLVPRPGRAGWVGIGLTLILWLTMIPVTYKGSQAAPAWFDFLLSFL